MRGPNTDGLLRDAILLEAHVSSEVGRGSAGSLNGSHRSETSLGREHNRSSKVSGAPSAHRFGDDLASFDSFLVIRQSSPQLSARRHPHADTNSFRAHYTPARRPVDDPRSHYRLAAAAASTRFRSRSCCARTPAGTRGPSAFSVASLLRGVRAAGRERASRRRGGRVS